jgi:hypothetical protein
MAGPPFNASVSSLTMMIYSVLLTLFTATYGPWDLDPRIHILTHGNSPRCFDVRKLGCKDREHGVKVRASCPH